MNYDILNVVAPILLIAGIGYGLERSGHGFDNASLSRLVMLLGTPSLVFSSLTGTELPSEELLRVVAGAAVVVSCALAGSTLVLRVLRLPIRPFVASLALPNSGNVGLPVALFAFGQEGLRIAVAVFLVVALCQYVSVPLIMAGRFRVKNVIGQPLLWSIFAVGVFKFSGLAPPAIIAETTMLLGGMMVPVMLILLGGALARLQVKDAKVSALLAVVRLLMGMACGALAIVIVPMQPMEAATVFLLSSMPAALVTYVFAERYGQAPERVAGLVVSSTVLTFALLPVLVFIALGIAGE